MLQGTIHLLLPRKGLGFIDGPSGEVMFDWSVVQGMDLRELTAGMPVEFDVVASPGGPRAERVRPLEIARVEPPARTAVRPPHFLRARRARQL